MRSSTTVLSRGTALVFAGCILILGTPGLARSQTALPGAAISPRAIAEIRARPCPAGMQTTTDELIAMSQTTPDQYWASVAAMDQVRHSPEYQAQFNAAIQQTRAQVVAAGGDVAEVDRVANAMRNDPALMMRCQAAGTQKLGKMPMTGMPGMSGMPGTPGLGSPGGDMIKSSLTQSMSSALPMLGPAGMLAGAAAPIAVPLASKAVGGLLGKKPRTPEQIAKDLVKGEELAVDGVKFSVADAAFGTTDFTTRLGNLAQAIASVEGVFIVYIQPEAEKGVEPDRHLAQQRLEKVQGQLLAAGVPADRIEGTIDPPPYGKFGAIAKPGEARIYLIRKRGTSGPAPAPASAKPE